MFSDRILDRSLQVNLLKLMPTYVAAAGAPYVTLNPPVAPKNLATPFPAPFTAPFQFTYDPGIKNPYLPIQFVNTGSVLPAQPVSTTTRGGRGLDLLVWA